MTTEFGVIDAEGNPMPPEPEVKVRRKKVDDLEERVTIMLNRSDRIPKMGLNVGVNGVNYLIKAGVPVSVPRKVVNVLKDAKADLPVMDAENNIVGYEQRSIYPFEYV